LRQLKKLLVPAAVLIVVISALLAYMFRGGFHQFEITTYKVPRAAFTTWNDVLRNPRDISLLRSKLALSIWTPV